jgi:hypothetical protein
MDSGLRRNDGLEANKIISHRCTRREAHPEAPKLSIRENEKPADQLAFLV